MGFSHELGFLAGVLHLVNFVGLVEDKNGEHYSEGDHENATG